MTDKVWNFTGEIKAFSNRTEVTSKQDKIGKRKCRFGGETDNSYLVVVYSAVSNSCNPMDYSPPGFSVHGIFQARILEWFAISFYRFLFGDTLCLHSVEYISHLHKRWRSKIRNYHPSVNNQAGRSRWDSSGEPHIRRSLFIGKIKKVIWQERRRRQNRKINKVQEKCRWSALSFSPPLWLTVFSWFLKIQQARLLLKVGVCLLSSLKPIKRQGWWKVYFQGQQPWGGRESGLLTKSQRPPPAATHSDNQRAWAFIDGRRGLTVERAQSALTARRWNCSCGGPTSIILLVLSTVDLQFQGQFVPISLRSALRIVAAYIMSTVWSWCS